MARSSQKRFAKEAKDSDKVNGEGDKANEGPSPKRKKLTDKERGAIEYGLTRKDSPALIGAILGRHPSSFDVLWEWLEEIWARVPADFIEALIDGMPRRVAAVIKANGGHTKY